MPAHTSQIYLVQPMRLISVGSTVNDLFFFSGKGRNPISLLSRLSVTKDGVRIGNWIY
jgi:hypothetical protein